MTPKPAHRPRSKSTTTFAKWLDAAKMTSKKAADVLGCSAQFVAHLRRGRYSPGRELANRIATASKGAVPVASWDKKK